MFSVSHSPAHPHLKPQVQWGIMGGVSSIPPAFSISFALACGSSINAAVHAYGRLLTPSTPSTFAPRGSARELQLLGYATDNGAYYYYQVSVYGIISTHVSQPPCLTQPCRRQLETSTAPLCPTSSTQPISPTVSSNSTAGATSRCNSIPFLHIPEASALDYLHYSFIPAFETISVQAAGSTGGEGVPLGGGLKNWSTNATWFAGKDP